jgi:threonine aldolase
MPAPDGRVDLRSDTVTRPTAEMRKAMADAEVGDDGFGDDPTVNRLQEAFAERVGKQDALFVPSGTMGNQIALRLLTRPGTTLIVGRRQHPVIYEQGAAGVNLGAQLQVVDDTDGTIDPAEVAYLVEAAAHHWPTPSAVCVENSHLPSGGRVWPLERLRDVADVGLPVHLDGARLFNAEVASGVRASDFAAPAATVMSCLSKGLGAPIGSVLAGPSDLIEHARVERKRLGGGMRQVGIVAAAGLVALTTMVERLAEDHARARRLAEAAADRWPDAGLEPASVETNVVLFEPPDPAGLLAHLMAEGVLATTIAPGVVRFVTHLDIDDADVERVAKAIASAPA